MNQKNLLCFGPWGDAIRKLCLKWHICSHGVCYSARPKGVAAVVEMASYEEDGMVGMMGRVGKDVTMSLLDGS